MPSNESCEKTMLPLESLAGMPISQRSALIQQQGGALLKAAQRQAESSGLPFDTTSLIDAALVLSFTVALTESEKQSILNQELCACSASNRNRSKCTGRQTHENSKEGLLRRLFDENGDVSYYLQAIVKDRTKSDSLANASILSEMLWMRSCEGASQPVPKDFFRISPNETVVVTLPDNSAIGESQVDWLKTAISCVPSELTVDNKLDGTLSIMLSTDASAGIHTFNYILFDVDDNEVLSGGVSTVFLADPISEEFAWSMCDGTSMGIGVIRGFQDNYEKLMFRIYCEAADAFCAKHRRVLPAIGKDGHDYVLAAVEKLRKAYLTQTAIQRWPGRSTIRSWVNRRATWDMLSDLKMPCLSAQDDGLAQVNPDPTTQNKLLGARRIELREAIRKNELPRAGLLRDIFGKIDAHPNCLSQMTWPAVQTAVLYHWVGYTQAQIAVVRNVKRPAVLYSLRQSWKDYLSSWAAEQLDND